MAKRILFIVAAVLPAFAGSMLIVFGTTGPLLAFALGVLLHDLYCPWCRAPLPSQEPGNG